MDIFSQLLTPADQSNRVYGMVVGVVTNNKDPDALGRVKVKFPWLSDTDESHWARVVTPMAGGGRGFYFLPEVDDEVLVGFEHGDVGLPYVLGSLWNGKDKPPEKNDDGKNNLRVIKSRSGHLIRLDDTDAKERSRSSTGAQRTRSPLARKTTRSRSRPTPTLRSNRAKANWSCKVRGSRSRRKRRSRSKRPATWI